MALCRLRVALVENVIHGTTSASAGGKAKYLPSPSRRIEFSSQMIDVSLGK
jgi:hypothetical protein